VPGWSVVTPVTLRVVAAGRVDAPRPHSAPGGWWEEWRAEL